MLRRIIAEMVSDSDRQLAALYAYLGKFLYENMEKARLYHCFTPGNERLESEAEMLLKSITGTWPSPLQESTQAPCSMKKPMLPALGRSFYDWHRAGKLKFIYGTEGNQLALEIERIAALVEYVKNKKKALEHYRG